MGASWHRLAAAALMAIKHVNDRDTIIVKEAADIQTNVTYHLADTRGSPAVGIQLGLTWASELGVTGVIGDVR